MLRAAAAAAAAAAAGAGAKGRCRALPSLAPPFFSSFFPRSTLLFLPAALTLHPSFPSSCPEPGFPEPGGVCRPEQQGGVRQGALGLALDTMKKYKEQASRAASCAS